MTEDLVPRDREITKPEQEGQILSGRIEFSQYSGPLPNPEIIAKYEKVLPGAAERILRLVESEQEHRHKMQEKQLDAGIVDQKDIRNIEKRGQFFALVIALSSISVAAFSVLHGQEIVASVFGVGGVGTLVIAFIQGKQNQRDPDR